MLEIHHCAVTNARNKNHDNTTQPASSGPLPSPMIRAQIDAPTIDAIRANRARLGELVITTPVRMLVDDALAAAVGSATRVWLKEELFQRTGSFKPRGALSVMLDLDAAALARGVTGVSAGNHAISLGYSARMLGSSAKVVMPKNANAYRVQVCRDLGVAVELVDNVHDAFARVKEIEASEGRTFVHPYEGPKTALGTASVGMEFIDQVRAAGGALDAVIVAAGGGGLTAGVACAVKQMSPETAVYVVEPEGADTLSRSFKPRGALSVMLDLDAAALARGVTGVSAGNHAISLGYSARMLGSSAKVVMPKNANAYRVQVCRDLGVEVELVDNVHDAFARVKEIEASEGRTFVHPYEGPKTALGTASVGMEFIDQVRAAGGALDAVIVAAGGGGLTAGVACAVKQMSPETAVYVVEPEGADTLSRSFKAGSPQSIDAVRTIADSLGAPRCEPYSFALNQRFVDEVVLVSDEQIRDAMRLLFRAAKLAVEPAGAAALAALMYPLRSRLDGRRVGIVVCGANIDAATFSKLILP